MTGRYPNTRDTTTKRVGRPPLPRWPELHPRYDKPGKLRGIDKFAYELALGKGEANQRPDAE